jgi:hypothetical protein
MPINVRQPNINAPTEAGRLEQIRSYLYQMSEQLNWALNTLEKQTSDSISKIEESTATAKSPEELQNNFNGLKSLIIKSADIVDAYYEEISHRLEGLYVVQSDFGTYKEETALDIEATSKDISLLFEDIQEINNTLEAIHDEAIKTNAYIKSGILYYEATTGAAIYGLEIGQTNTVGGVQTFDKFARFTADRLSFYDSNDTEVAYISDYMLFITNAKILGTLYHGGYKVDSSDGLAYMWNGRD